MYTKHNPCINTSVFGFERFCNHSNLYVGCFFVVVVICDNVSYPLPGILGLPTGEIGNPI